LISPPVIINALPGSDRLTLAISDPGVARIVICLGSRTSLWALPIVLCEKIILSTKMTPSARVSGKRQLNGALGESKELRVDAVRVPWQLTALAKMGA
jgi:hypothetical protein